MDLIKYDKQSRNGKDVWYEILENGFNIYIAQTLRPAYIQTEPYIPDPSKTYEENALKMCEELCMNLETGTDPFEERLTAVEANIDYLMLLNDSIDE